MSPVSSQLLRPRTRFLVFALWVSVATLNFLDLVLSVVGYSGGIGEADTFTAWLIGIIGVNGFVVGKILFSLLSLYPAYVGQRKLATRGIAWTLGLVGLTLCLIFAIVVVRDAVSLN